MVCASSGRAEGCRDKREKGGLGLLFEHSGLNSLGAQTFILLPLMCTYASWVIYSELTHLRRQGAIKHESGTHSRIKNGTACKSRILLTQTLVQHDERCNSPDYKCAQ